MWDNSTSPFHADATQRDVTPTAARDQAPSRRDFSVVTGESRLEGAADFIAVAKSAKGARAGKIGLILVDASAFALAGVIATAAFSLYIAGNFTGLSILWRGPMSEPRLAIFLGLVVVAIGWFWQLGHYARRRPFWDELQEITHVLALLAIGDAALLYLAKLGFSRFWFLGVWAIALVVLPLLRFAWKRTQVALGRWQVPTVVIGAGENAREAAEALSSEPLMGLHVVAFATQNPAELPPAGALRVAQRDIPVLLLGKRAVAQLRALGDPNIVVALESNDLTAAQPLISRLHRRFHDLSIVPPLKGLPLYGMEVHHFFRHEALFLRIRNNLGHRAPRLIKRSFDILGSALLLLLLAPLFAYLAYRVRQDGGSVFFGHERIGQDGKAFKCYKFRSMAPNAQQLLSDLLANDPDARAEWEKDFKLKNDPRITPIGALLRRTSLDELPQLWNVLKGEMSLVGPRPVVHEELRRYGDEVEYYLEAKPGMTGLWQISGRNDTGYEDRVYLDAWYARNWSLWSDIVILLKTIRVVVDRKGAY